MIPKDAKRPAARRISDRVGVLNPSHWIICFHRERMGRRRFDARAAGVFDFDDRMKRLSDLRDQLETHGSQDKRFRLF